MTDGHFEDGYYSLMRIWDKGVIIDEHEFLSGIPNDVKGYLISHGFLSNEHWENECETSPIDDDFGTDTSITMIQRNGDRFVRRVKHAHKSYHNLLLDELIELLTTTSLKEELKPDKDKRIHTESFVVPSATTEFIVIYEPSQIGPRIKDGGFRYSIRNHFTSTYDNKGECLLDHRAFQSLLTEIENLGIQTGVYKKDTHVYSEIPGKLDIKFNSNKNNSIHLSLVAFNTDMQGGNIYGSNIIDLAESIHRIVLKYLPEGHEPTRELIYSIPESTSEIRVDYSEGGIIGQCPKPIKLGIVKDKKHDGVYSPKELSNMLNGLRKLKLRSQDEIDVEPSTGIVFPKLTLTFVDNQGNILKEFYAEDSGDKMIGNTAISVNKLKDELSNFSKSFKDRLAEDGQPKERKETRESTYDIIFRFILFSIVIGIIASPTYFFAKPKDDLFLWLWTSIGAMEFFSAFLFSIGGKFNNTSSSSNFETLSFLIGILALIAYIVLWIIQMCFWWA